MVTDGKDPGDRGMVRNGNGAVPRTSGSSGSFDDESFARQFKVPSVMNASLVNYFSKNTDRYLDKWKDAEIRNERLEHELQGMQVFLDCQNDLHAERQYSAKGAEEGRS